MNMGIGAKILCGAIAVLTMLDLAGADIHRAATTETVVSLDGAWQLIYFPQPDATAMKTFCELFRSRKFTRFNGLVWWNVRDGWPQLSDAVVDYYGGKKRAYYALKNAQRDQIVCVVDDHTAWAVNDARRPVPGTATFTDAATVKILLTTTFEIPANGKLELGKIPFEGQGVIKIEATLDGAPFRNHFLYGEPPFVWADIQRWLK